MECHSHLSSNDWSLPDVTAHVLRVRRLNTGTVMPVVDWWERKYMKVLLSHCTTCSSSLNSVLSVSWGWLWKYLPLQITKYTAKKCHFYNIFHWISLCWQFHQSITDSPLNIDVFRQWDETKYPRGHPQREGEKKISSSLATMSFQCFFFVLFLHIVAS